MERDSEAPWDSGMGVSAGFRRKPLAARAPRESVSLGFEALKLGADFSAHAVEVFVASSPSTGWKPGDYGHSHGLSCWILLWPPREHTCPLHPAL